MRASYILMAGVGEEWVFSYVGKLSECIWVQRRLDCHDGQFGTPTTRRFYIKKHYPQPKLEIVNVPQRI